MSLDKKIKNTVFTKWFRENKTVFADAPQNGKPVVLNAYANPTHANVVSEIEAVVDEFEIRVAEVLS